jgi:hypothetical protein
MTAPGLIAKLETGTPHIMYRNIWTANYWRIVSTILQPPLLALAGCMSIKEISLPLQVPKYVTFDCQSAVRPYFLDLEMHSNYSSIRYYYI